MKVGEFKIKRHYTIIRLILDLVSAGLLYLIWQTLYSLIVAVNEVNVRFLNNAANSSGITLSWYPALVFPIIAVLFTAATLIFTFKSRKLPKKYTITEKTAQKYYDMLVLTAGLIRIITLLGIFDIIYMQSMLILGMGSGFISIQVICDIILIIILIKFTSYRILVMSNKESEKIKKERQIIED